MPEKQYRLQYNKVKHGMTTRQEGYPSLLIISLKHAVVCEHVRSLTCSVIPHKILGSLEHFHRSDGKAQKERTREGKIDVMSNKLRPTV